MQKERIQKVLARAGVASRRKIEEYVLQGVVTVNGKVITQLGITVDQEIDKITVNGHEVLFHTEKAYFLFYKPRFVISSCFDEKKRKTVLDYFQSLPVRLYPVGRLDYDSDGLLLLTNDGDFTYALTHPKHKIDKAYLVQIQEGISDEEITLLERGVELDGYKTKPCHIKRLHNRYPGVWLEITLFEGRNRQIRKMLETFQKQVLSLTRIRIGLCTIGELTPGTHRPLTREEIGYFLNSQPIIKKERS